MVASCCPHCRECHRGPCDNPTDTVADLGWPVLLAALAALAWMVMG